MRRNLWQKIRTKSTQNGEELMTEKVRNSHIIGNRSVERLLLNNLDIVCTMLGTDSNWVQNSHALKSLWSKQLPYIYP